MAAKRTKTSNDENVQASRSKEPSTGPSCSRHTTVMSEKEDAAMNGEDAIHIPSSEESEESEAESSEAELSE